MNGDRIGRQLSLATRRELIEAIAARYRAGTRIEKKTILDEFIEVTGFHRKHVIRALRKACRAETVVTEKVPRARLYNEAAIAALTVLWETADRICGKRLKEAIPTLVAAMERHGHLQLDTEVRQRLFTMSAATMDRLLKPVREAAKQGRRRTTINTALRKSIVVRTIQRLERSAAGLLRNGYGCALWKVGFGKPRGRAPT